jgi:hypothetical protein
LKLVEYVLSRRSEDGSILQPLRPGAEDQSQVREAHAELTEGFAEFVLGEDPQWDPTLEEQRQAAIKGVLGMMRFGHHDSPILLEALGDLLSAGKTDQDARQLAARAYLRASQEAATPEATDVYRQFAGAALPSQYALSEGRRKEGQPRDALPSELEVIETELAAELEDARGWIAQVHENERRWVAPGSGVDPEAEFAKLYGEEPLVDSPNADKPSLMGRAMSVDPRRVGYGILLVVLVLGVAVLDFRQRRQARKVNAAADGPANTSDV